MFGIYKRVGLFTRIVLNFGRTSPLCDRMVLEIIYVIKLYRYRLAGGSFALFFHPCVYMDVYAGNYCKKSISFSSVDAHGMQMVIVQDAVVYPFTGCAVFINFFIFPRAPGNRGIKARIPVRFCIDAPPVWGFGAFIPARAGIHFAAGQRTAPFAPAAAGAISPVYHPVASLADGRSILIDNHFIWNGFWHAAVGIQVDKRPDVPCFTKVIGRVVVIGGIKAHVLDGDGRIQVTKFFKRDNPADTVVASCIQETDM